MPDYYKIVTKECKDSVKIDVIFVVNNRTSDIMIRGGDFYAVWVPQRGLWSTNEQDVIDQIDDDIDEMRKKLESSNGNSKRIVPLYMHDSDSGTIDKWHKFCKQQMRDKFVPLDGKITFSNTKIKKTDYVSKSLPYPLEEGPIDAYEELISTLYNPSERQKLEWSIGAIISGDAKHIEKFIALYGTPGSGKGTFLKILTKLFDGYFNTFDAKSITSGKDFALESFSNNPLVSIQNDANLSRIKDNTKLNSLVSHEYMEINAKYTKKFMQKFESFLYVGTNNPV